MLSEHIVLGRSAEESGRPANPRDYAAPGNQDPAMPWPSSLVLLSAIAARTTTLRLVAGAVITPLRHPLLLAKELGTLDLLSKGRLVVLPTVSWHAEEYAALGVDFRQRGAILDEQLAVWRNAWRPGPSSFSGRHYSFDEVWVEPKAWRADGPRLWFGGSSLHAKVLERLVAHGHGWNPFGPVGADDLALLRDAMASAGRTMDELELVGGVRTVLPDGEGPGDLGQALSTVPEQWAAGFTTICVKPAMFISRPDEFGDFCRDVVSGLREVTG